MKIKMDESLQVTILAVQTHYKALYYGRLMKAKRFDNFDMFAAWQDTRDYFLTIPLPEGMAHSTACFEAIMLYPIKDTMDTEAEDLGKFEFGY